MSTTYPTEAMSRSLEAPRATLCDPHCLRDLDPSWACSVPGCDCGSTPSQLAEVKFQQELAEELRHRYELLELNREAEALRVEAKRLRDPWWLPVARWVSGLMEPS